MEKVSRKDLLDRALKSLLLYTILVIVWGAWVRISKSGDGCGASWPLCQGDFIPQASSQNKTWIEYAHRIMSGLYGFFVLWVWLMAKAHPNLKKMAHFVLVFMILEALLGAKLVLFGLVGENASLYRAFVMALHQVNSLLLVGSITWLGLQNRFAKARPRDFRALGEKALAKIYGRRKLWLWLFCLLAVTGAFAALSGTLFPSESLWQGIQQDLQMNSHPLLRLRIAHPVFGLGLGGFLIFTAYRLSENLSEPQLRRASLRLSGFAALQMIFGVLTLILLSPTWMKLIHLTLAHGLWISLVSWIFLISYESSPDSMSPESK